MSYVKQYMYLPRQLQFFRNCDAVRYNGYIGGFGSGKTHVLILQSLREATRPSYGLIGAPTYRMLEDTTRKKFFELCPEHWIDDFHKSANKVRLINGTEILFRALETPERLTNLDLSWWGLDEMGEIPGDTFRMLTGRLRRPGGSHHGFGVGNPAGPAHWTYEYFVLKAQQHPDLFRLVQAPSTENKFIRSTYTEDMAKSFGTDSLYYKRFVLGQFVAFEGAYWPHFNVLPYPNGHVIKISDMDKVLTKKPRAQWRFGKVLDFGYEHPWVLMWYATDGHSIVFYDEYYQRHKLIREHLLAALIKEEQHRKELGIHRAVAAWTDHDAQDRAEIENCYDGSGRDKRFIGFKCHIAEKEVMKGILHVQSLIQEKRLFITDRCTQALREVPSYRAKPAEKVTREEPLKENDHTCDCIRMAAWMELKHTTVFTRSHAEYALNQVKDIHLDDGHYARHAIDRLVGSAEFAMR